MSGTSFKRHIDPRGKAFVRFLSDIHAALETALLDSEDGTKKRIANRLEVDKSVVTRLLSGSSNMTLRSLSDLAWALDCTPTILLTPNVYRTSSNVNPEDSEFLTVVNPKKIKSPPKIVHSDVDWEPVVSAA